MTFNENRSQQKALSFLKDNVTVVGFALFIIILKFFSPFSFLFDVITFGIFALGYDLLLGHLGWVSFGHLLYYGFGAYVNALSLKYVTTNPFIALLITMASSALLGLTLSFVLLRKGGAYFALLNLGFCALWHFMVVIPFKDYTGGNDGTWFKAESLPIVDVNNRWAYFYFLVIVLFVVTILYRKLISSPFGFILRAMKENEDRVRFLGYNVFRWKMYAFIISVVISALAGALYTLAYGYASPSFILPNRNGEIIVATLLGGSGTVLGPLIGALILTMLKDLISSVFFYWEFFVGIAFVFVMSFLSDGVWGRVIKIFGRR